LINNSDTILLGKTDIDGKFLIQISTETKELVIGWVGMEWKTIILPNDCDNLDIILMFYANYDIISHRKVDRLRKRRFNKLSEIHQIAYKKGPFCAEKPCYRFDFEPIKKRLDELEELKCPAPNSVYNQLLVEGLQRSALILP
jgi:hypothetical protein